MKNVKISLAGDLGSGKSTVGKILAERFGAEVYSTGTIQRKIAMEMGMSTLALNQYMETHPEIDGMIDDGLRALEGEEKSLIIDSRMAWHFVPSSFAVYMMAHPRISAERIMNAGRESERFGSMEEAEKSVSDRRKSEMLRYSHLYGVNIKDLENYDLVIDTSYVTPETVASHIAAGYEKYTKGEKFARYEICAARLLPCSEDSGEPSFFEDDGMFFIAGGAEEIAKSIRGGAQLISCSRVQGGKKTNCTREKIRRWEEETGIKVAQIPCFLH